MLASKRFNYAFSQLNVNFFPQIFVLTVPFFSEKGVICSKLNKNDKTKKLFKNLGILNGSVPKITSGNNIFEPICFIKIRFESLI